MTASLLLAVELPSGQGWSQIGGLLLAFALASLIGLERELRHKSAGLRTHTVVGVAAALIMLVSKYGFTDVLSDHVTLDPSRVAAQIVSGIGFIGGGLIFVRRDAVQGLTTAAIVWLTAAVGMAAGAGMPIVALLVTGLHFVVVFGFTPLAERLPRSKYAASRLEVRYLDGHGVLREVLEECTRRSFSVSELSTDVSSEDGRRTVAVLLQLMGRGSPSDLASTLSGLDGVLSVRAGDEVGNAV
jgi:putative Mg2+ transporter-C (MgtC) family protein